jgi:glycosyltransferase involved in cell wall biosynthesis
MISAPQISIILSFYNEADNIPELISRLRGVLVPLAEAGEISGHELVFVNDASTDHSLLLLQEHDREHGDIRILNMSRNFGVSTCVLAGMEYCSGDVIVYMDSDLQDPPETIPQMLFAYKNGNGVEVVHTVRRARDGETAFKLICTRLGYWILKYIATIPLQIEAGDFKLISRRVLEHLVQLREKRPYLRGLVCWVGFKQDTVYYRREPRFAGETKFIAMGPKVIANFFSSALIAFSDIPLQLSSWFGALVSLLSLLFSAWLGLDWLRGQPIPGWALPFALLSFIAGAQLFSIGLLGLYVAAIHVESKRRPNYITESTYGFQFSPRPSSQKPPRHD